MQPIQVQRRQACHPQGHIQHSDGRIAASAKGSTLNVFTPSRPSDIVSSLAVTFTFKRLCLVFVPALAVLILPPVIFAFVVLLNNISRGWGLWSLLISASVTQLIILKIKELAPSPEKRQEALQWRNRIFTMFLALCLFIFRLISNKSLWVRNNGNFHLSALKFCPRLAVGLFFLSLLVCLRYVSVFGIAQASTFPLPDNPFEKIFYTMSSFNRLLDQILAQDDTSLSRVSSLPRKDIVKRYRQPILVKTIIQIIIHGFFGALFSYSIISAKETSPEIANHLVLSCTILLSFSFAATYISAGGYHELSPNQVLSLNPKTVGNTLWKQIQGSGILFYWIIIPIVTVLGLTWLHGESIPIRSFIYILAVVYPTTLFMVAYTLVMDIASRVLLLQPGLNVDKFVNQNIDIVVGGSEVAVEDIMAEAIVGGLGVSILEDLISPRLNLEKDASFSQPTAPKKRAFNVESRLSGKNDLEEEEIKRNDVITSIVAQAVTNGSVCGYRSFEEDLLTMAFLESMGGVSKRDFDRSYPHGLSRRHYQGLQRRLVTAEPTKGQVSQPAIVPVLRSMCAYIGGFGTALTDSTSSIIPTSMNMIPPSAPVAVGYAVRASSRLIVMNMVVPDSTGRAKKRYNRISLMLPVVLESIFRLRCGILDYVRHKYEQDNTIANRVADNNYGFRTTGGKTIQAAGTFDSYLAVKYSSLSDLVTCCDDSAIMVLKALVEVDGTKDLESISKSSIGCQDWLGVMGEAGRE